MKTRLFYRPNSEHETAVLEYLREFERRTGKQLETVDVDSREGVAQCDLYGLMQYPVILATDNQGSELRRWEGDMLPQIGEVSYYVD